MICVHTHYFLNRIIPLRAEDVEACYADFKRERALGRDGLFWMDTVARKAAGREEDCATYSEGMRTLTWCCGESEIEAQKIKRALDAIGLNAVRWHEDEEKPREPIVGDRLVIGARS